MSHKIVQDAFEKSRQVNLKKTEVYNLLETYLHSVQIGF